VLDASPAAGELAAVSIVPFELAIGVVSAARVPLTGAVVSNGPATCVSWAMMVWAAAVYTASGFCAVAGGSGVARAHAPRPKAPKIKISQVDQRVFLLRMPAIFISSVLDFTSGCSLSEFHMENYAHMSFVGGLFLLAGWKTSARHFLFRFVPYLVWNLSLVRT
jgi:hypothetical protein